MGSRRLRPIFTTFSSLSFSRIGRPSAEIMVPEIVKNFLWLLVRNWRFELHRILNPSPTKNLAHPKINSHKCSIPYFKSQVGKWIKKMSVAQRTNPPDHTPDRSRTSIGDHRPDPAIRDKVLRYLETNPLGH